MSNSSNKGLMMAMFSIFGVIALIIGILAYSYISNYNYGNSIEKQIQAKWENNENILAGYSKKIAEMAQVPAMYRDDLSELYKEAMSGRYGEDGSNAMWQWLKEQNPQLDSSLYQSLQQTIQAGRNEFTVNQTSLVDVKRQYETNLGYLWKGMWLRIAGYPKINLEDYKIITNNHARNAFETGSEEAIELRPKKQ